MRISKQFLYELQHESSIVGFISGHIDLRRSGKSFQARCPFHAEKTPSFSVYEPHGSGGIYRCFGCSAQGSIIDFAINFLGLEFVDAVEHISGWAQREIVYEKSAAPSKEDSKKKDAGSIKEIFEANHVAQVFFEDCLWNSSYGEHVRTYLKDRKIHPETAKAWHLGLAPDSWDALINFLQKKGVSRKTAQKADLVVEKDGGRARDRFSRRLVFPIFDGTERVRGFGGRALEEGGLKRPKYLNTSQTPVFSKSKLLYGIHEARKAWIKGFPIIVVEGYFDVIALHQNGISGAISPMGTALTEQHLQILKGRVNAPQQEIILIFDGDEAGRIATLQATFMALQQSFQIGIVRLPSEHDPCSWILEHSRMEWDECIKNRDDGLKFWVEEQARPFPMDRPSAQQQFLSMMSDHLYAVRERPLYELLLIEIGRLMDQSVPWIKDMLLKIHNGKRRAIGRADGKEPAPVQLELPALMDGEVALFSLWLSESTHLDRRIAGYWASDFLTPASQSLFSALKDECVQGHKPDIRWLLSSYRPHDETGNKLVRKIMRHAEAVPFRGEKNSERASLEHSSIHVSLKRIEQQIHSVNEAFSKGILDEDSYLEKLAVLNAACEKKRSERLWWGA